MASASSRTASSSGRQGHGSAAPLDDLRAAQPPTECRVQRSASSAARCGSAAVSVRFHPVVRSPSASRDPAAQHRQVAQRGVTQRSRLEPRDVAGERGGLREVAGADDGVDRAQQPLLALRPGRRSSGWPPPARMLRWPRRPNRSAAGRRRRGVRPAPDPGRTRRRPDAAALLLRRRPTRLRLGAAGPDVGRNVLVDRRLHQRVREDHVPDVDLVACPGAGPPRPLPRRRPSGRRAGPALRLLVATADAQHRAGLHQRLARRTAGGETAHDLVCERSGAGSAGSHVRHRSAGNSDSNARTYSGLPPVWSRTRCAVRRRERRHAEQPSPASGRSPPSSASRLIDRPVVPLRQPSQAVGHAGASSSRTASRVSTRAADEPAKGEQQRSERVDVRPLSVIDQQHDETAPFELSPATRGAPHPHRPAPPGR